MTTGSRGTSDCPRSARPGPVWTPLALFTSPELAALLGRRREELQRDLGRYRRLHASCRLRSRTAPRLPAWDVGHEAARIGPVQAPRPHEGPR